MARSKKKQFLAGLGELPDFSAKDKSAKDIAILTLTHGISAAAGAFGGVFIGSYGPIAGIATMAAGAATGESHLIAVGGGMFAGPAAIMPAQPEGPVDGLGEFDINQEIDKGQERVENFLKIGMKKAFLIDKIMPKKEDNAGESDQIPENTESGGDVNGYLGAGDWYIPQKTQRKTTAQLMGAETAYIPSQLI